MDKTIKHFSPAAMAGVLHDWQARLAVPPNWWSINPPEDRDDVVVVWAGVQGLFEAEYNRWILI